MGTIKAIEEYVATLKKYLGASPAEGSKSSSDPYMHVLWDFVIFYRKPDFVL